MVRHPITNWRSIAKDRSDSQRRVLGALAVVCVLLLAVVIARWVAVASENAEKETMPGATTPAGSTTSATQRVSSPPTPTRGTASTEPDPATSIPVPTVPVSRPLTMSADSPLLGGLNLDIDVMPYEPHLEPPKGHPTTAYVVDDAQYGSLPGSDADDSVYLLCHSWSVEYRVCNPIAELAVASAKTERAVPSLPDREGKPQPDVVVQEFTSLDGSSLSVQTEMGDLRYAITGAFTVAKGDAWRVESMQQSSPGTLLLVTCATDGDVDLDFNVVVVAELAQATPKL